MTVVIDELVNGWWDDALSDVNTNVTSFAFKEHNQSRERYIVVYFISSLLKQVG